MRICVISDTHIPDRASDIPQKVLEELKSADMVIHAGDFADISVLRKLRSLHNNVKAVWGNMDGQEIRNELPQKEILKIGKHKIGITHGFGPPNKLIEFLKEAFKQDNVNLIIFGHSHSSFNEKVEGILFFNPGSLTDKIFSAYNSYGIIEINDKIEAKIVKL